MPPKDKWWECGCVMWGGAIIMFVLILRDDKWIKIPGWDKVKMEATIKKAVQTLKKRSTTLNSKSNWFPVNTSFIVTIVLERCGQSSSL